MSGSDSLLKLAILVSGGGRSLENLSALSDAGSLKARPALVIANRPDAFALNRAKRLEIEHRVIPPGDFATEDAFRDAVFSTLEEFDVDLAVLAGYLVRLPMVDRWKGRVINIHPALLPDHGGKGYYGHHVHEAVSRSGTGTTGCTVHFVDDEYDHGPIILQRSISITPHDDPDTIAEQVFEEEKKALPEAINLHAEGKLEITGQEVRIRS